MNSLLVILGSGLGGGLRYWMSLFISNRYGETFPWGTLIVNIAGCFAIGFFATISEAEGRWAIPAGGRVFFMTGICGGFTTFSSFSLQTLALARDSQWLYAGLNILGSVTLCLFATWLGHFVAAPLHR